MNLNNNDQSNLYETIYNNAIHIYNVNKEINNNKKMSYKFFHTHTVPVHFIPMNQY